MYNVCVNKYLNNVQVKLPSFPGVSLVQGKWCKKPVGISCRINFALLSVQCTWKYNLYECIDMLIHTSSFSASEQIQLNCYIRGGKNSSRSTALGAHLLSFIRHASIRLYWLDVQTATVFVQVYTGESVFLRVRFCIFKLIWPQTGCSGSNCWLRD